MHVRFGMCWCIVCMPPHSEGVYFTWMRTYRFLHSPRHLAIVNSGFMERTFNPINSSQLVSVKVTVNFRRQNIFANVTKRKHLSRENE